MAGSIYDGVWQAVQDGRDNRNHENRDELHKGYALRNQSGWVLVYAGISNPIFSGGTICFTGRIVWECEDMAKAKAWINSQ